MSKLYDELKALSKSDYYPFHMPGHKRNMDWDINPYEMDITEIDGFDNLHDPKGILKELENRISKTFKSRESFILVNGSTGGILASIFAVASANDTILIGRNCHKSVYNGAQIGKLTLEYIYPNEEEMDIPGEIISEEIKKKLEKNKNIKAVIITSPTYEGVVSDIEKIAKTVHDYGKILIVDEAHGSHLSFSPYFPDSAVNQGADIVINSFHKTLPAFTQSAVLHINGNLVDVERLKMYLGIFQSSSPSYILMAGIEKSLEVAENIGFEAYTALLEQTRKRIKALKNVSLFETKNFDRSKLVICCEKLGGAKLYQILLDKYHLQMEMAAEKYVIAMTSVCDKEEGFSRLVAALEEIDRQAEADGTDKSVTIPKKAEVPEIKYSISQAKEMKSCICSLENAAGRAAYDYINLYPPGIPLVAPGEIISDDIILRVKEYIDMGLCVQGVEQGKIYAIEE